MAVGPWNEREKKREREAEQAAKNGDEMFVQRDKEEEEKRSERELDTAKKASGKRRLRGCTLINAGKSFSFHFRLVSSLKLYG